MDHLFQFICNIFPHYKLNNKFKKKFFYLIYCIFKYFIKGPFVLNFRDFKFYSYQTNICIKLIVINPYIPAITSSSITPIPFFIFLSKYDAGQGFSISYILKIIKFLVMSLILQVKQFQMQLLYYLMTLMKR